MADSTDPAERALMKRWVDQWKFVTGPELERAKREELRAMSEKEGVRRALSVMDARFKGRWRNPSRRTFSGLIEQQRLFVRLGARPL